MRGSRCGSSPAEASRWLLNLPLGSTVERDRQRADGLERATHSRRRSVLGRQMAWVGYFTALAAGQPGLFRVSKRAAAPRLPVVGVFVLAGNNRAQPILVAWSERLRRRRSAHEAI